MLTLIQLQAMREVVATGSLRTAAKNLGYTPSAVSQQITTLERTLGVQLFERSARSVRPTAAGVQLARHATRLLSDLKAAEGEILSYATGERGRLHLGSFWSAGFRLVPEVLAEFLRDRSQVDVRYEEGDPSFILPAVVEGRLDLALVFEYGMVPHNWPSDVDRTLVLEEPLYILLPPGHPLARRAHVRVADLADERWICFSEKTDASHNLFRICATAGFSPKVLFRTNDYNLPFALVRLGLGVAVVPELAMKELGGLHAIRLAAPAHVRRVFAVRRTADQNPHVRKAIELLRTVAGSLDSQQDGQGSATAL